MKEPARTLGMHCAELAISPPPERFRRSRAAGAQRRIDGVRCSAALPPLPGLAGRAGACSAGASWVAAYWASAEEVLDAAGSGPVVAGPEVTPEVPPSGGLAAAGATTAGRAAVVWVAAVLASAKEARRASLDAVGLMVAGRAAAPDVRATAGPTPAWPAGAFSEGAGPVVVVAVVVVREFEFKLSTRV